MDCFMERPLVFKPYEQLMTSLFSLLKNPLSVSFFRLLVTENKKEKHPVL